MNTQNRMLLSGNEAVALAARDAGVAWATAYPGTPSTEILEALSALGGPAQWSPNEKVAYEVALGAAWAGARALVTMKHVGVNVAADPMFTSMHTGVSGAFVLVSADDPGMASSQNEQDNRRYGVAAAIPILEPSNSQEAYDFTLAAFEMSERWRLPVMLRVTTRVCHSKTVVKPNCSLAAPQAPHFERNIKARTMIPGYARPAHRRLRAKIDEIAEWSETSDLNTRIEGSLEIGIITSGVAYQHAREAAPDASFLKLGTTHPLPMKLIQDFVESVERCIVIEENDPYLVDNIRAAGIYVEGKPAMYRFDELNVPRVRRILDGDESPEFAPPPGKPPQLCVGCPHRMALATFKKHDCILMGDIGCYTLAVMPPLEAMDSCVCMGASIGTGLGMRHVLPPEEARRVVSVIGDSTFVHSGITGLVEMVYNPPETGHVVLILDNGTTAMTGMQEHPGTGRSLNHEPANQLALEDLARAIGITNVHVVDPKASPKEFKQIVEKSLASGELEVIITRHPCKLLAGKLKKFGATAAQAAE